MQRSTSKTTAQQKTDGQLPSHIQMGIDLCTTKDDKRGYIINLLNDGNFEAYKGLLNQALYHLLQTTNHGKPTKNSY